MKDISRKAMIKGAIVIGVGIIGAVICSYKYLSGKGFIKIHEVDSDTIDC